MTLVEIINDVITGLQQRKKNVKPKLTNLRQITDAEDLAKWYWETPNDDLVFIFGILVEMNSMLWCEIQKRIALMTEHQQAVDDECTQSTNANL